MIKDLLYPDVLKELNKLKTNSIALSSWHSAMPHLAETGIIDVLRELARVQTKDSDKPNFIEAQAAEANRAYGVAQAIELLLNFRELLQGITAERELPADFGGLQAALDNQDITQEEADAIRLNQPIPKLARIVVRNATSTDDNSNETVS